MNENRGTVKVKKVKKLLENQRLQGIKDEGRQGGEE